MSEKCRPASPSTSRAPSSTPSSGRCAVVSTLRVSRSAAAVEHDVGERAADIDRHADVSQQALHDRVGCHQDFRPVLRSHVKASGDRFLDHVRGLFAPDERRGMFVPRIDVVLNVGHERAHRLEGTATNGLARQNAEPHFDEVQPRGAGRREMKLHGRMRLQPGAHGRRGMGRRIVENHVQGMSAYRRCTSLRNARNSVAVCRGWHTPTTWPERTLKAAYKLVRPLRR